MSSPDRATGDPATEDPATPDHATGDWTPDGPTASADAASSERALAVSAVGRERGEVPARGDVAAVQVAPEHYDFERYDDLERWNSYWYQIRAALRLAPRSVLEIGSGSGVFRSYLRGMGIDVKSADIDDTRRPDFIADVSRLDETLPEGLRFDVVAAFQVLEHLPFDRFEACLDGIRRRATRYALISLPCNGFQARLSLALGALRMSRGIYLRLPWKMRHTPEHYWELGPRHSIRRITRIIEKQFRVEERHYVRENPYHYLWVLRVP